MLDPLEKLPRCLNCKHWEGNKEHAWKQLEALETWKEDVSGWENPCVEEIDYSQGKEELLRFYDHLPESKIETGRCWQIHDQPLWDRRENEFRANFGCVYFEPEKPEEKLEEAEKERIVKALSTLSEKEQRAIWDAFLSYNKKGEFVYNDLIEELIRAKREPLDPNLTYNEDYIIEIAEIYKGEKVVLFCANCEMGTTHTISDNEKICCECGQKN